MTEPFTSRHGGPGRARALAAGLGAAALAGAGALTVTLAPPASTAQASSHGTTSTNPAAGTVGAPQQLPASGGATVHASSGGS